MQGNGEFHHTQIGSQVAGVPAGRVNDELPEFIAHQRQFIDRDSFQVIGGVNMGQVGRHVLSGNNRLKNGLNQQAKERHFLKNPKSSGLLLQLVG
jgi:hypothetical protein